MENNKTMENDKTTKTELGLNENIEGLLCYSLGFLTGILFLILEKENKFIKFHAVQSIIVFGGASILWIILWIVSFFLLLIPIIGWIALMFIPFISLLIFLVVVILWILLMVTAYQGKKFKLPIVGDFAEKQISK